MPALASLALCIACVPGAASAADFFSPSLLQPTFTCPDWVKPAPVVSQFEAGWYSRFWTVAKEPSLFELSRAPGAASRSVYRFTWLRTFHQPIFVRVERAHGEPMRLVATRLSGQGGYDPGRVEARVERVLTADEEVRFDRALAAAKNLSLPARDCTIGMDGAEWILEASDAGAYRYVKRWSPDDGPVRDLGLVLLRFTGWQLEPVY